MREEMEKACGSVQMPEFLAENRARIELEFGQLCARLPGVMAEVQEKIARLPERMAEEQEKKVILPVMMAGEQQKPAGDPARTALALKYLYSTMPYSDLGNYTFPVFLDYASHGVMLWEAYASVRSLPEEIFLNYVLYHRVNEEEIAPCRALFYEELKPYLAQPRPAGELVQQVNLWCASQVSYRSSDDRTASARTVYACGYGRCGEESVFAVNALRSAGIPARQVYAPRWSHCDDNHAWVEVWLDGEWHFLGACEPCPALDCGWFNGAASRAVLVHSRWFDTVPPLFGGEQVIGREGMALLLNQTRRYAAVKELRFVVTDVCGAPVQGARVTLQVLNYAELATIAELVTDECGHADIQIGYGSVHVVVQKGRLCAELQIDGRPENSSKEEYRCVLETSGSAKERWIDFDMYAPSGAPYQDGDISGERAGKVERNTLPDTPCRNLDISGERAGKAERNAQSDALCREAEFQHRVEQAEAAHREKVSNWKNPECGRFLRGDGRTADLRRRLLDVLSDKDRTDLRAEVLEEHLRESLRYRGQVPEEPFVAYLMNPRIYNEVLTPWRACLAAAYPVERQEQFRRSPALIWDEIQERIREQPERERSSIFTTPKAALRLGIASEMSRRILFVAMARSLGIPARLNPQDQEIEYWEAGAFHPVGSAGRSGRTRSLPSCADSSLAAQKSREHYFALGGKSDQDAKLFLRAEDAAVVWKYARNWTLTRLNRFRTEEEDRRDGSAVSVDWDDFSAAECMTFGDRTLILDDSGWNEGVLERKLEPGTYRLLTTNRLPNGNQLAAYYDFCIRAGQQKTIWLRLREAKTSELLGNMRIPEASLKCAAAELPECGDRSALKTCSLSELAGKGRALFLWLEEGREPTEHILNELMENREAFGQCGGRIVLVLRSERALADPTLCRCRNAVPGMTVCFHDFGEETRLLARSVYTEPDRWPLVILAENRTSGLTALYGMSGYQVGMGEMVLRILDFV